MIQTQRLHLRPFSSADELQVVALLSNEEFMVFSPTGAMSSSKAKNRFAQLQGSYEECGFGKLAVIEGASKELIGYCGIEACEIEGEIQWELGFRLISASRGKGYATEAAAAVLCHAAEQGVNKIIAFTEPENQASINVLKKLGFGAYKQSSFSGMHIVIFKRSM